MACAHHTAQCYRAILACALQYCILWNSARQCLARTFTIILLSRWGNIISNVYMHAWAYAHDARQCTETYTRCPSTHLQSQSTTQMPRHEPHALCLCLVLRPTTTCCCVYNMWYVHACTMLHCTPIFTTYNVYRVVSAGFQHTHKTKHQICSNNTLKTHRYNTKVVRTCIYKIRTAIHNSNNQTARIREVERESQPATRILAVAAVAVPSKRQQRLSAKYWLNVVAQQRQEAVLV